MTEDWLAQREIVDYVRNDKEGYEKVVDLFCLHVLPRLHDWEYAREFLEYESELPDQSRQVCIPCLIKFRISLLSSNGSA